MLLPVVGLALRAGAADAQVQTPGIGDLPGQRFLERNASPLPFDPRLELREHFRTALPTSWWAEEPQFNLGRYSVVIHVPQGWQGNPTSAMMGFCPLANSNLWREIREISLTPFYQKMRWPGYLCRP